MDCSQYGTECGTCSQVRGFIANEGPSCADNENGQYCFKGYCSKCQQNKVWGQDNKCWACTDFGQYIISVPPEEAHKCLGTAFYATGRMIRCQIAEASSADEISCKACSGHCLDIKANNMCRKLSSAHVRKDDGTCTCGTKYFFSSDGNYCRACQTGYETDTATSNSEAHRCLGTDFYANGRMYHCDSRSAQPTGADKVSCINCNERCFDAANNNTCRLLGNTYDRDANGYCVPK